MIQNELLVKYVLDNNDIDSLQQPHLHKELSAYINNLILNNFNDLVYLLYRVDVSEKKLKALLKENDKADAGEMIATLIIERQVQKIKSRLEHGRDKNNTDGEEKW
jgi:hypothetical protein